MAFEELHRHVAAIALRAVGRKYEVALAGGNALMVHDIVDRRTEDVDLFVRRLGNVSAAAAEIEAALRAAGYAAARIDQAGGLADIWPDAGEELAEWEVTAPDGEHTMQLQAAYFELLSDPVTVPEIGPVLALDDLAGWKTVALANRMMARDYVDVAALLEKYTVGQLIALARERDPGLADADFADAGVRLDRMRDGRLAPLLAAPVGGDVDVDAADVDAADGGALGGGASAGGFLGGGQPGEDVAWLRRQFADWPRDAAPRA